jgi:hypothetical protein
VVFFACLGTTNPSAAAGCLLAAGRATCSALLLPARRSPRSALVQAKMLLRRVTFPLGLCLLLAAAAEEEPPHTGFGCQKRLSAVCPGWQNDKASCERCVRAHLPALEPNCTLARATEKCATGGSHPGTGLPVGPTPLPPTPPTTGAVRPHMVMFVVDDMGWANIGFHNPGNVFTPNLDAEAAAGVILDRHYAYRWCAPTRSSLMVCAPARSSSLMRCVHRPAPAA